MGRGGSSSGPARPAPSPERALLDLVGLAARAGALVHGTDATRRAVREGGVLFVLMAADGAAGQLSKLVPLLEARGVPYAHTLSRAALGAATGREFVSAIGIIQDGFARRARQLAVALAPQHELTNGES
jgi:ribosomal protein L7Ae-like RNA K-turn-binding protein